MPTPKDAIAEALLSLDQTNDKLWTDDGSPLVAEVQRICNDPKITRAQINDAIPGFARKTSDSVAEDEQPEDEAPVSEEAIAAYVLMAPPTEPEAPEENFELSAEDDHERLRLIAQQRVKDAELALTSAKDKVSEAQREVVRAEQRLTRAMQVFSSKYPPISAAENIHIHLARQQELLRERVTGSRFEPTMAQNPVDATLMDRKRDNGRNGKGPRGQAPAPFLPRRAAVNY